MNLIQLLEQKANERNFNKAWKHLIDQGLIEEKAKKGDRQDPAYGITIKGEKYSKLLQKGIMVNAPFTEARLDMFLEELKNGKKFTEEELEKMNAEKIDA